MDKCDEEVFNFGTTVAVASDVSPQVMEAWCQKVAKESGQKVDWGYMAGRAVVKALGDLGAVDKAAYWHCICDGKPSTMQRDGALKGMGGAKSCYGYFPGGHNHWSNFIGESSNGRMPDSESGDEGSNPSSPTNE